MTCLDATSWRNKHTMIEDLIRRAGTAARETGNAREAAWEASVAACRAMEGALVEGLDGEPLTGMRNLVRLPLPKHSARSWSPPEDVQTTTRRAPWCGAQVRRTDLWDPLLVDTPALCLTVAGRLAIVTYSSHQAPDRVVVEWPAQDDDLRAEDAAPFARALEIVLHEHLLRSAGRSVRYRELEVLADRLRAAVVGSCR